MTRPDADVLIAGGGLAASSCASAVGRFAARTAPGTAVQRCASSGW